MIEEIWTEKYRPRMLRDIVGQKHILQRLQAFVDNKSLPHSIFSGPAGTGKTTAALCIARELYGNNWHSNFLELNASDTRGIDTIRVQVKDFARTMSLGSVFKIIYLDEADSLTRDAQHALRRTMERYAKTTRFILACNYSSRLIAPIQSRCAVFRFSQLAAEESVSYLKKIAQEEDIKINEDAYKAILYISEGDMRKAVNVMQTASIIGKKITEKTIYEATNRADPNAISNMVSKAVKGDFMKARDDLLRLMIDRGLAGEDIIREIHSQVFNLDLDDMKKLRLLEALGDYDYRIVEGSNARIQLEAMLAKFGVIGKE
jgi:replication factor C small subunit